MFSLSNNDRFDNDKIFYIKAQQQIWDILQGVSSLGV